MPIPAFVPADTRAVTARLRSAAQRCAGDDLCEIGSDTPAFLWMYGSTLLEASAQPDGSVLVRAFLVLGPCDDGHLEERVAAHSSGLQVGRLVVDEDGDVLYVHRIPAGTPRESVEAIIREVCRQADRLDDILCAALGGIRSLERFRHDVLHALGAEA